VIASNHVLLHSLDGKPVFFLGGILARSITPERGATDVKEEQKLFDPILNCLQTNPWMHLNLEDILPCQKVAADFLSFNKSWIKINCFLKSWNQDLVQSNGMRLFLCGSPRAGK
jgi:hypothetical protein